MENSAQPEIAQFDSAIDVLLRVSSDDYSLVIASLKQKRTNLIKLHYGLNYHNHTQTLANGLSCKVISNFDSKKVSVLSGFSGGSRIEGLFQNMQFLEGHSFFDSFSVFSRLLNLMTKYERKLNTGLYTNVKAMNIFQFYESILDSGSESVREHGAWRNQRNGHPQKKFAENIEIFRHLGFEESFIDVLIDYTPEQCSIHHLWHGFAFNYPKPLIADEE